MITANHNEYDIKIRIITAILKLQTVAACTKYII